MTSISNRNKHLFVTETRVDKKLTPEQLVNNYKLLKKYMPEALPENMQEKYFEEARPKSLPKDFNEFLGIVKITLNKNKKVQNLIPRDYEILKFGKEALNTKAKIRELTGKEEELLKQIKELLSKTTVSINMSAEDRNMLKLGSDVLLGKTVLFDAVRNNEYLPPCRTYEVQVKKSPKHKKNKVKELNKMVSQAKAEQKAEQQAKLLDITSKTAEIKQPPKLQNLVGKTKSIIQKALRTALSKAALL